MSHEIFLLNAAGFEPTVANLVELLPEDVAAELLDVKTANEIPEAIDALDEDEEKELLELLNIVMTAAALEREDLEPLLAEHDVPFGNNDSTHALALALVRKLTTPVARDALTAAIKPGQIDTKGTFSDYKALDYDISSIDVLKLQPLLEKELEARLSQHSNEKRRVKVRASRVAKTGRLILAIYFTRPKADGRDITTTTDKRLITRPFERPALATFVTLKRGQNRVIVTFRSPASRVTHELRAALSMAIWKKHGAVESNPLAAYDLQRFTKRGFKPTILSNHANVGSIALADIRVSVASGNRVTVATKGRRGDALDDFKELANGAPFLTQGSFVEQVTLKFMSADMKPRLLTRAVVDAHTLNLKEEYRMMVEAHLEAWGVRGDG